MSTSTPMESEFESALGRYLDGEASREDEALLARAVQNDAGARAEVRRHLLLDDLLRQHEQRDPAAFVDALRLRLSCTDDEVFVQRVSTALQRSSHRVTGPLWQTPWVRVTLAAAAMLVVSAVSWLTSQRTNVPVVARAAPAPSLPSPMPTSTPAPAGPGQMEPAPAMPDPEPMPADDEVVVRAADEPRFFTLPSGVRVLGSPGTSLAMVNDMAVKLDEGRVAADAGSAGKGFTVRTPQASIVDVGTLFGVQARTAGITDVVVFSGAVLLTPQGTQKATQLITGQAVSVDDQGRLLRLASVTAPERWQFWQTEASAGQCIASIDGPETAVGVQAFHRIIPGGLKEGVGVAVGHPERWRAVTGKRFPHSLMGADFVQSPPVVTGAVARWPLRVSVQRAATVFLLVSQAAPPPKWLTAQFSRTGEEIASVIVTEGKPKARISNSFDVWKHTLDSPGVLTLGEPTRMADGKLSPMYGIAAKAR